MEDKKLGILVCVLLLIALVVSLIKNEIVSTKQVSYDINEKTEHVVALTFDDGPKEGKTEALLDMLKEKGVKATFFVIGAQVKDQEEILKRASEEGHQIGVHTYNHVDMTTLSESRQQEEVSKSMDAVEAVTGTRPTIFRPPFGKTDCKLENWIECPMILWSVDTRDWTGKKAVEIIMETVDSVKNGDIILMHDIAEYSVTAAAGVIDELKRLGYTFLTVDQLFQSKGIDLENGQLYHCAR